MRRAAFYKNKAAMAEEDDDDEEEDEDEEEEEEVEEEELENKRIRGVSSMSLMPTRKGGMSSSSGTNLSCQADNCPADMAEAKRYHKRHKVCEFHAKAPVVLVAGLQQRFCQQCSRFHEVSEFDEAKRSCRRRLAGHNERRRKSSYDLHGEGSN